MTVDKKAIIILKERKWWYQVCEILNATLYAWSGYNSATLIGQNGKYEIVKEVADKLIELSNNKNTDILGE